MQGVSRVYMELAKTPHLAFLTMSRFNLQSMCEFWSPGQWETQVRLISSVGSILTFQSYMMKMNQKNIMMGVDSQTKNALQKHAVKTSKWHKVLESQWRLKRLENVSSPTWSPKASVESVKKDGLDLDVTCLSVTQSAFKEFALIKMYENASMDGKVIKSHT